MATGNDLALPGALDEFIRETDQLVAETATPETPEEGTDQGRANAAFAKMRTRLKEQNQLLREVVNQVKQPRQSQSQSQGRETPTSGAGQTPWQKRQQIVQARAVQLYTAENGRVPNLQDPADVNALSYYMTEVIAEERADEIVSRTLGPFQGVSLTNIISGDKDLRPEDLKPIQERIEQLREGKVRVTPEVLQVVVDTYKGTIVDKIIERRAQVQQATKSKGGKPPNPDEIEDQDGIFGAGPGSEFAVEKKLFAGSEGKAAASAASGRKSGKGVGLGEDALAEGAGDKSPPKLSDEDVIAMRRLKLDPSNPENVEDYIIAKRKKPEKSGLY